MLTSRVYVLTGAVNGWLENSSPEQYSCNLMSTRQKTMRLRVHCAKTRSMFEPLDTDIKTRTRKCEVVYGSLRQHLMASSFRQSFRLRGRLNTWFCAVPLGGVKLPAVLPGKMAAPC